MSPARFPLLDALRGLAALWVFTFHFGFSESFHATLPLLYWITRRGHLGVPVFFVISGYCITASAANSLRHGDAIRQFLYRRMRRIYPTYWFSILATVALPFVVEGISFLKTGHFVFPTKGFVRYGVVDWLGVFTLAKVFEPLPVVYLQTKFADINAVYWTLAIEVQFYLAVALALASRRIFLVLGLLTLAAAGSMVIPGIWTSGIFLPYWPTFAAGALLYAIRDSIPRWLFNWEPPWLLSALGAMSYSLYLLHGPMRFLGMQVVRQIVPVGVAFDVGSIALTCLFCWLFYWACERPFVGNK